MTRLVWDQATNRRYEAGVDRGVFYPSSGPGEVWNGLVSVQESPSDSNDASTYLDGVRVSKTKRPGEFLGAIEAFTYPENFFDYTLTQRRPKPFGLSYRVQTENAYLIHLVYNIMISPIQMSYDQGQEPSTFSWEFSTRPIRHPEISPVSHLVVESALAYSWTLSALEDVLYGNEVGESRLPSPIEVLNIFEENSILQIIDHGDGTWTAIGPDDVITMLDPTTFQIDYPTAVYISPDTYTIHSL